MKCSRSLFPEISNRRTFTGQRLARPQPEPRLSKTTCQGFVGVSSQSRSSGYRPMGLSSGTLRKSASSPLKIFVELPLGEGGFEVCPAWVGAYIPTDAGFFRQERIQLRRRIQLRSPTWVILPRATPRWPVAGDRTPCRLSSRTFRRLPCPIHFEGAGVRITQDVGRPRVSASAHARFRSFVVPADMLEHSFDARRRHPRAS